jgi:hypothetical protein
MENFNELLKFSKSCGCVYIKDKFYEAFLRRIIFLLTCVIVGYVFLDLKGYNYKFLSFNFIVFVHLIFKRIVVTHKIVMMNMRVTNKESSFNLIMMIINSDHRKIKILS